MVVVSGVRESEYPGCLADVPLLIALEVAQVRGLPLICSLGDVQNLIGIVGGPLLAVGCVPEVDSIFGADHVDEGKPSVHPVDLVHRQLEEIVFAQELPIHEIVDEIKYDGRILLVGNILEH